MGILILKFQTKIAQLFSFENFYLHTIFIQRARFPSLIFLIPNLKRAALKAGFTLRKIPWRTQAVPTTAVFALVCVLMLDKDTVDGFTFRMRARCRKYCIFFPSPLLRLSKSNNACSLCPSDCLYRFCR